jgi:hypothetical protein
MHKDGTTSDIDIIQSEGEQGQYREQGVQQP